MYNCFNSNGFISLLLISLTCTLFKTLTSPFSSHCCPCNLHVSKTEPVPINISHKIVYFLFKNLRALALQWTVHFLTPWAPELYSLLYHSHPKPHPIFRPKSETTVSVSNTNTRFISGSGSGYPRSHSKNVAMWTSGSRLEVVRARGEVGKSGPMLSRSRTIYRIRFRNPWSLRRLRTVSCWGRRSWSWIVRVRLRVQFLGGNSFQKDGSLSFCVSQPSFSAIWIE